MFDVEIALMNGIVWTMYGYNSVVDALHAVGVAIEDNSNVFIDAINIFHHEVGNADASSG